MGMLATVMNALSLQSSLEKLNIPTRVQSAITMSQIAEPYIRRRAIRHLEKGRIVIVSGGTGNPFFTTDSAAALRAKELGAKIVIKGTKVDGIYDKDPKINNDAKKYDKISFNDALSQQLKVMDAAAFSLCMENNIPIVVFDFFRSNSMVEIYNGDESGTLVSN